MRVSRSIPLNGLNFTHQSINNKVWTVVSAVAGTWTQVQTRCSQLIKTWMGDNRNKWLSNCTRVRVCYRCWGHVEERKNAASLATSASVCPCEGAEEEKGWGNERLGSEGLPFNADYRPIRGSQTVKDCGGEGGGQLRGRPRRSIISSKETPSTKFQISFAQLRPNYTHLSVRRATPWRQLTSCLNGMRICNDSSCSLETRTDTPTR